MIIAANMEPLNYDGLPRNMIIRKQTHWFYALLMRFGIPNTFLLVGPRYLR